MIYGDGPKLQSSGFDSFLPPQRHRCLYTALLMFPESVSEHLHFAFSLNLIFLEFKRKQQTNQKTHQKNQSLLVMYFPIPNAELKEQ